jgi:hypothetical protein
MAFKMNRPAGMNSPVKRRSKINIGRLKNRGGENKIGRELNDDSGLFYNSAFKQEGPIDKKNLPLQPGELEGTYLYGQNYGDEDIPGKGEGFEPGGTRGERFNANERINDLEERISFLYEDIENSDDEYLGGGDAERGARIRERKQKSIKRLEQELAIMYKRRENERK